MIPTCTVEPVERVGTSTIVALVDDVARRHGSATWMAIGERTQSFSEMAERVSSIAGALLAAGVEAGDAVGLFMGNRFEWLQVEFAVASIGARLVPLNTWLRERELTHILSSSQMRLLMWDGPILGHDTCELLGELLPELTSEAPGRWRSTRFPALREVIGIGEGPWAQGVVEWPRFLDEGALVPRAAVTAAGAAVRPADVALVVYTSGTTGLPKGAMLTHTGIVDHMREWARHLGVSSSDRAVMPSPLFWIFGCAMNAVVPLLAGSGLILEERFDAARMLGAIDRHRATHLQGVPDQYELLLGHAESTGADLSTIRLVQLGGSRMNPSLPLRLLSRAPEARMITAYGLTEAVGVNTWTEFDDPFELLGSSIGHAAPDNEATVRDPDTLEPVGPGEVGELWLKGAHVTPGYLNDAPATEAAFVDGWFRTGDLVIADEGGYFSVAGRRAHTYKRGGMNVYPAEAEVLLSEHPAVAEATIVGVPDERLGQVGAAFVVLADGAQIGEQELIDWCAGQLARYKVPAHIRFTRSLPRTPTGKVQKFLLEQEWST